MMNTNTMITNTLMYRMSYMFWSYPYLLTKIPIPPIPKEPAIVVRPNSVTSVMAEPLASPGMLSFR